MFQLLQNGHAHFKESCRFKIYYQIQDHLLYYFKRVSDQFGILGIKVLRIFLKNFSCYLSLFFTISTFKLRQLACIYIYVQLFLNFQTIIFAISKT